MDISTKLRLIKEGYFVDNINFKPNVPTVVDIIKEDSVVDEFNLFMESINIDFEYSLSILNESTPESENQDVNPIIKFLIWLKEKIMQFINFLKRLFKMNSSNNSNLLNQIESQVKEIKTLNDQVRKAEKSTSFFGIKGKSGKYIEELGRSIDEKRAGNKKIIKNPKVTKALRIISHPNPEKFEKFSNTIMVLFNFVEEIEKAIPGSSINGKEAIGDNELGEFILFYNRDKLTGTDLDPKKVPVGDSIVIHLKNTLENTLLNDLMNSDTDMILGNPEEFIKRGKTIINIIDKQQNECVKYVEKMRTKVEKMETNLRRFKFFKILEKKAILLRIRAIKVCIDIANVITNHILTIQRQIYNGMTVIQKMYDTEIKLLRVKKDMATKLSKADSKKIDELYKNYLDYINSLTVDDQFI